MSSTSNARPTLLERLAARLDEAIREVELRRYRRLLLAGRLPFVYALGILVLAWVLTPFLFAGSGVVAGADISRYPGWVAGSLFAAVALAAALGGYLRSLALWNGELQLRTLHTWLLTRQSPRHVAHSVVVMGALLGLALTTIPVALGLVVGLFTGLRDAQAFVLLLVLPLCALAGSSIGAAVFFVNHNLVSRPRIYLALALIAAIAVGLWLWVEAFQHGWQRNWDEHPARIMKSLLLLTPAPTAFALCAPEWWQAQSMEAVGFVIPAWGLGLVYSAFLGVVTVVAGGCSTAGYARLADDPGAIEPKPREISEEGGEEFYWQGFRNPVLTRDIRTRLRSKETAEFLFFTSIAVAAGGFLPLLMTTSDLSDPLLTARAARQVFFWLTLTLVALVALVAPGLTAEVITRERATGTLEALVGTPLRPREILTGKLLGAICVLLLLITPSLPLFGLCYLFHGASGTQVVQVYLLLTVTLSVCALIGITQSSIHAKAGMAKFWAYASTALFVAFPGGPLWLAAWAAAPQAEMRQALSAQGIIAGLMMFFYVGFLALFWGNACEQLEYSEY